jgi:DNA-binding transcriptional ArsR family regulator
MTIAATFEALGDPTRRQIVAFLAEGETAVAQIAEQFNVSGAAISQHLKVLRDAGLVRVRKDAQQRFYSLERHALADAATWLARMSLHRG